MLLGGQLELVDLCGIAQGSQTAIGHRIVEPEVVTAENPDVSVRNPTGMSEDEPPGF